MSGKVKKLSELEALKNSFNDIGQTTRIITGQEKAPVKTEPIYKNIKNPSTTMTIRLRKDLKDKLEKQALIKGYPNSSNLLRAVIAEYLNKEGLL